MFERLTMRRDNEVFVNSEVTGWTHSSHWSKTAEEAIARLATYEDTEHTPDELQMMIRSYSAMKEELSEYRKSGLSPDEVQELAQAKTEGRLVVPKAELYQIVWFYDGANRLMQGEVLEYLNCGNGFIYQVHCVKKELWLHEHEIYLTREKGDGRRSG